MKIRIVFYVVFVLAAAFILSEAVLLLMFIMDALYTA